MSRVDRYLWTPLGTAIAAVAIGAGETWLRAKGWLDPDRFVCPDFGDGEDE